MVSGRSSTLRADARTTPEVRRFAIRWLVAAVAVLVAAGGIRALADRAEQDARTRADALSEVASSVTVLRLSLHLTADERTATPPGRIYDADLTRDITRAHAA